MTDDRLEGKWKEAVGYIKKQWGEITDQDLEKIKGNKDQLIGMIQNKYGETKEAIENKINDWLDKL